MKRSAWTLLMAAAALALGASMAYRPWQAYLQHRKLAESKQAAMVAAEARRAELTKQRTHLESRVGREETAREQGYRRPGETSADGGL